MYNGYLPTTHEGLIDTIEVVEPFDIPVSVFSGENDQFGDMAPALAAKFANSLDVHSSTADHHLPYQSDPTFDTIPDLSLMDYRHLTKKIHGCVRMVWDRGLET